MMVCGVDPRAAVAGTERVCATTRILGRRAGHVVFAVVLLLAADAMPAAAAASSVKPDFSGTWERYPDPYDPDSRIPDDPPPPGGEPQLKEPYASEYKNLNKRKAEANEKGRPLPDPSTLCVPEGMPTIMGAIHPIEILHTPQQIIVLAEFLTQTRRIYLNEDAPALEDISPGYNGHSVGRWEGETLVVETIGVREDVKFMGFPHSAQMKVTERLRLTAPDLLENRITIDDPDVLAKPYEFTFGYKRSPDYRIMEYICDNNRHHPDAEGGVNLDVSSQ